MRYKLQLSFSAQNMFLCALIHFFSINDVTINRKKIKKFMSESENKYEYRSYTAEEIGRLLLTCDERERAIILILSSTGMRVGAVHPLRLKDLKRWKIEKQDTYIYQIQVYSSSSKYRYYTFCTPECAVAIDSYLELRQRYGEKLIKTETGWGPQNASLIIRAFNRKSFYFNPIPIQCRTTITTNIIVPKLEAINLRNRKLPSDKFLQKTMSHERGDLHPCHSFRIFAITQMQRAKIDKTIREMLVGHSTGLDSVYYKASEEEIYLEYLKAIDNLTISNANKSKQIRKEHEQKDQEEIIKLKEKHEADLAYVKKRVEERNEVIQLAPFYETEDSVRKSLSEGEISIDIEKWEKEEKSLIIVDSLKKYSDNDSPESDNNFNKNLVESAKTMGKAGVSILTDTGAFPFKHREEDLVIMSWLCLQNMI